MGKRKIVPCAACRHQHKKCSPKCILAPHFPSHDPEKFAMVESVYEINYIIDLLQDLEFDQRDAAVNSLVHEASARVKNPIQGTASIVEKLKIQKAVLESQFLATTEELLNICAQYADLVILLQNKSR